MRSTMRLSYCYVVAACVGICFGLLAGGAVLFAHQTSSSASVVEAVSGPSGGSAPSR